jgi:hypothetical protein
MKRVLLILLAVILIVGVVGASGFTGYRFGYAQGVQVAANGEIPRLRPFDDFGPRGIPDRGFGFDREFHRGFRMHGFPMMGFGLFSLFRFLVQMAVIGLIVWFVYWLFTRSGYRITRSVQTTTSPTSPIEPEAKE